MEKSNWFWLVFIEEKNPPQTVLRGDVYEFWFDYTKSLHIPFFFW